MAEQAPDKTPYHYVSNNPINRIDPDGREAFSPIFNKSGKLLGTDDQGVSGEAIIMDENNFEQGMSHDEALEKGTLYSDLPANDQARTNAESFMEEAHLRPDYNGEITYNEANSWARRGSYNAQDKYGNGDLFVDVSKIDISKFTFKDIKDANKGGNFYFNFLSLGKATGNTLGYFFMRSDNTDTGMIYGNIRMEAGKNGTIHMGNRSTRLLDIYDFNTKDGSYYKRGANAVGQHISTVGGKYKINEYSIYSYGTKKVSN